MKTITFYSYKGGVGRSLVLANLAQRLVEFGKSVCMLDFDLEAPGLPFKFGVRGILDQKKKGIVDFVTEYQNTKAPPKTLDESYSILLNGERKNQSPLHLITAGNTDTSEYWANLAAIDWKSLFYSPDGQGYRLMLHLKALIEKEIKPDYLLIDSRTGVTETSGIAISILAERVVIVAANNQENIYGSKLIMKGLQKEKQADGSSIDVHFILSRVPFNKEPNDRLREKDRIDALAKDIKADSLNIAQPGVLLIHSERELEANESLMIGNFKTDEPVHIGDDYRKIFKYIISQDFKGYELTKFDNQETANQLFSNFQTEKEDDKKLAIISRCIDLNPQKGIYYIYRAHLKNKLYSAKKNDEVINDYEKGIDLEPFNENFLFLFIIYLKRIRDVKYALAKANLGIERWPNLGLFYDVRASLYNSFKKKETDLLKATSLDEHYRTNLAQFYFDYKKYHLSYINAYKVLGQNPKKSDILYLFAKLQYEYKNSIEDFYLYLDRALELDSDGMLHLMMSIDEFFKPFLNEERFKRLLYKYNIEMTLLPKESKDSLN